MGFAPSDHRSLGPDNRCVGLVSSGAGTPQLRVQGEHQRDLPRADRVYDLHNLFHRAFQHRAGDPERLVPSRAADVLDKLHLHLLRDRPRLRRHVPLHEHSVSRFLPSHRTSNRQSVPTQVLPGKQLAINGSQVVKAN